MKKKLKLILIILLVLLVLVLILLRCLKVEKGKEEQKSNQEIRQQAIEEYFSDKILPQGVSTLYGTYQGENDKNDLYRSIAKMMNFIPQLSKEFGSDMEEKVRKYFSENQLEIQEYLGILEEEDFLKLVNYLSDFSIDNNKYQYCSIDANSYDEEEDYLTFTLKIVYENNVQLNLKVYFAYRDTTNPEVKYTSLE